MIANTFFASECVTGSWMVPTTVTTLWSLTVFSCTSLISEPLLEFALRGPLTELSSKRRTNNVVCAQQEGQTMKRQLPRSFSTHAQQTECSEHNSIHFTGSELGDRIYRQYLSCSTRAGRSFAGIENETSELIACKFVLALPS